MTKLWLVAMLAGCASDPAADPHAIETCRNGIDMCERACVEGEFHQTDECKSPTAPDGPDYYHQVMTFDGDRGACLKDAEAVFRWYPCAG